MFFTLDDVFREYQADYRRSHKKYDDQHTSHVISVLEHKHLATSFDHPSNYRMQRASTNQSVHNIIDRQLLFGPSERRTTYIPPQAYVERITRKTDQMKKSGEIFNPTNYEFLRSNAELFDMDLRIFNGISPRASDLTFYRGVGRPRESDYTSGGNLRRKK